MEIYVISRPRQGVPLPCAAWHEKTFTFFPENLISLPNHLNYSLIAEDIIVLAPMQLEKYLNYFTVVYLEVAKKPCMRNILSPHLQFRTESEKMCTKNQNVFVRTYVALQQFLILTAITILIV